jgi:hypothetical protein
MEIETNKIKELYKGHYQVILDFPKPNELTKILDVSYKYVWGVEHQEVRTIWNNYDYLLFKQRSNDKNIMVRNIEMEYLIETTDFLKLIPNIHQTIHIIQTNIIPPYYLNLKQLSGKGKFDLLKSKIDYLFELEMPGAIDYATLISPDIAFLGKVINNLQI